MNTQQIFIYINFTVGLSSGLFNLWYALRHANGKKPLRLISAFVLLYFAFEYGRVVFGFIPDVDLGLQYFRPFQPILMLMPAWDAWADGRHHGAH